LFRYLDKQPIASTMNELQSQVDRFDLIYNTQRPHQSLPGRITPQQAWDATTPAQSPRRPRVPPLEPLPLPEAQGHGPKQEQEQEQPDHEPQPQPVQAMTAAAVKVTGSLLTSEATGASQLKVYSNGTVRFNKVVHSLTTRMASRVVIIHWDVETIMFATVEGEVIAVFGWPEPGVKHVGMKSAQRVFG